MRLDSFCPGISPEVTGVTPWLRLTLRLVRVLLVLATTAVPVCGTATAYGAESAPPGSPTPSGRSSAPAVRARNAADTASPSPTVSKPARAGSRGGEGRMRPGRPELPDPAQDPTGSATPATPEAAYPEEPETADSPAAPTPTATSAPASRPAAVRQGESTTARAPRVLPLGSGLVLLGLGLALARLGLRIRRT
ncbi:hypothetical protein [Streptomyces griseoluteus]|uniref:hypothetical protein n=1 Tax=Streptomyces griseoluteus TaxID=29306 RepID=UPI0037F4E8C7